MKQLRSNSSLGRVSMPIDASFSAPFWPRKRRSQNQSNSGIHQHPASVTPKRSPGKRSKTPDHNMNQSGRAGHHTTSVT